MKDKFIAFWTHNTLLKFLSLVVAFILWLIVVNYDDPTVTKTYSSIPVEFLNPEVLTDNGKVYDIVDDSGMVSVQVKAKRSVQNLLSRDDFKATADLGKLFPDNTVPVEVKAVRFADRIDAVTIKGKGSIALVIDDFKERQFNIQVETTGDIYEGYMVGNVSLDKNVVKVSGPMTKVDQVSTASVTVDVGGMTQDISTTEDIVLYDENGQQLFSQDITLSRTSVGVNVQIWTVKTLPVTYGYQGEPAGGYGLTGALGCEPEMVQVAGVASVIDSATSPVIPSSAVDITGATSDKKVIINLEDYVENGMILTDSDKTVTVTVGISALQSKMLEIPTSNIQVLNTPEGMVSTVGGLGDVTAVELTGLGPAFDNLDAAKLNGFVDVLSIYNPEEGELAPGIYETDVNFNLPEGVKASALKAQLIVRNEDAPDEPDE